MMNVFGMAILFVLLKQKEQKNNSILLCKENVHLNICLLKLKFRTSLYPTLKILHTRARRERSVNVP